MSSKPSDVNNNLREAFQTKQPTKIAKHTTKVNVLVSVTYSKSVELVVEEGYTDVDLRKRVQNLKILPNDILKERYDALTKYIASNDWLTNGESLVDLLLEKQRFGAWHEDEFEVIEE